ncbi:regulator of chromosome condensation 1/beta-lactamase-inhibitor protein II [Crassisporium funariophilum]|nr:regulator of chromosome condensation 1/beta-lactamase-inhibitor protein II [Crassisporium funariophilum]
MPVPLILSELPVEVFLDNLLPYLPVTDLLRLTCTSKLFAVLGSDDTFWKRKLQEDFNFTGEGTARTSGWKFIYRGLFKPRVFVWGETANGRLGLSVIPKTVTQGVPFPTQVRLPGVRVVNLVAGGMSFHALDSNGNVHVWGTLSGLYAANMSNSKGYSESAKQARSPLKLEMPAPIRSISCGRLHSSCLDRTNTIWTFTSWGRPYRLSSSLFDDPGFVVHQVECGWAFSSLLTKSGEVYVWWPFAGRMKEIIDERNDAMDGEGDKKALPTKEGVIPCVTWVMDMEPTRLPDLPALPRLRDTGNEQNTDPVQLIQIAAFDNHIVGLTNYGHVLKRGFLHDESGVSQGRWDYLPQYSEAKAVGSHPVFSDGSNEGGKLDPPQTMKITHITANFLNFTAYSTGSTSIVLIGDTNTSPQSQPNIIPALQHKSIISVVIGDYHNAALTASGKLLTWGKYSNGALGLGDPLKIKVGSPGGFATSRERDLAESKKRGTPDTTVDIPTEVRFDHHSKGPKDRFCFAATAAGWHTGALVIDLEPGEDEEEIPVQAARHDLPTPGQSRWGSPPIIPMAGIFRVGHAGRGGFGSGLGGLHQHNPNNGEAS